MRKKILATILVAGLLAAQTLTAFANPSDQTGVTADTGHKISSTFDSNLDAEVLNSINTFNSSSTKSLKDLTGLSAADGLTALTNVFDCTENNCGETGSHTVTFNVPALTASMTNVTIFHYNGSAWEVIPTSVSGKSVTGTFSSLSPVVIGAKVAATPAQKPSSGSHRTYPDEDTNNGGGAATPAADATGAAVSPKTGVTSTWGVWAVAGLAFAGAACVVVRRKRA